LHSHAPTSRRTKKKKKKKKKKGKGQATQDGVAKEEDGVDGENVAKGASRSGTGSGAGGGSGGAGRLTQENDPKALIALCSRQPRGADRKLVAADRSTRLVFTVRDLVEDRCTVEVDEARDLIACGGIDIDEQDEHLYTALMYAIVFNRTDIAKELIRAGADLDKQGLDGKTAILCATQLKRTEIVMELVRATPSLRTPERLVILKKYNAAAGIAMMDEARDYTAGTGTQPCGLPSCPEKATDQGQCTMCLTTWYCSKKHQRSHWKVHEAECGNDQGFPTGLYMGGGADGDEGKEAGKGDGDDTERVLSQEARRSMACRVLSSLSVKELKKTITDAGLSHADCFEKPELCSRAFEALEKKAAAVEQVPVPEGKDTGAEYDVGEGGDIGEQLTTRYRCTTMQAVRFAQVQGQYVTLKSSTDSQEGPFMLNGSETEMAREEDFDGETRLGIIYDDGIYDGTVGMSFIIPLDFACGGQGDPYDADAVKLALRMPGMDINRMNPKGETVIEKQCSSGRSRNVALLLADARLNPNLLNPGGALQSYGGGTPLTVSAGHGSVLCLKLLLADHRVDPNLRASDGRAPLYLAAHENKVACVEVLLADGRVDVCLGLPHHSTGTWSPLVGSCVQLMKSMNNQVGTVEGIDPTRSLVIMLKSRRIPADNLMISIAVLQRIASQCGGSDRKAARFIIPILEAQAKGEFRWCGHCLKLTPDVDLNRCGGCNQVGYCEEAPPGQTKPCHVLHWKAGHKQECARFAAEADERVAAEDAGAGGMGGGESDGGEGGAGGGDGSNDVGDGGRGKKKKTKKGRR
jgi:ankyrin repeat protein